MSDGFAKMSRSDQLKIGRDRLLRCLAKCGGEYQSVRHLDVQNKYLEEYNAQLSKSELRKLFNKGRMQEVLQEYLSEDVEIAIDTEQHGVLFLKLKKSLKEALAHQPKIAPNLVPASKEGVSIAKIVPVHRSIGNFVDEVPKKQNEEVLDEDIFENIGKEKAAQLMADLGLSEEKKTGAQSTEKVAEERTEAHGQQRMGTAPRNLRKGMPKKKPQHLAILTDSEEEAEETEEKPNGIGTAVLGNGGEEKGRATDLSDKAQPPPKSKGVIAISHAEKYIMRVKQNREEMKQQQKTEQKEEMRKGTGKMQKQGSSEDEEPNEWDKLSGASANGGPTANGKRKNEMTKYDAYLYSAVVSTFLHVHKSTTLSKLHNYLSDNYSDGNLFRHTFPEQADLLDFVRTNCKNIRCSQVSSNEFALLWSEESEGKMVRLLLKVGKVLSGGSEMANGE
ncbi:hypothetical protein niasHS_015013 [Heterodera schachtii]|uniref:DUF7516 domain-containing protein n=2 Tax=Heterodera TaxID=34509 RepID=A0ABD2IDF2_HETSC